MTKVCPVHHFARNNPERIALRLDEHAISYAALDDLVNAAAVKISSFGIEAGMRVGLHLQRSAHYVAVFWALLRLQVVVVPLNTRLPKSIAIHQLLSINACVCITDQFDSDWPRETEVLLIDLQQLIARSDAAFQHRQVDKVFESASPASILFTSGSTGRAKAVLHTWGNHYYSAIGSNQNIVLKDGDTWLLSLPLYHVAGVSVLFRCFLAGAAIAILAPERSLMDALTGSAVSHVSLVATQLLRLLEATGDTMPSSLKAVLVGGSAIPASLIERAHHAGWPVHTTYGMTEMASQITTTSSDASLGERLTSGRVLPHRKVTISVEGEICVGGDVCFAGYVEGDAVKEVLDPAGYYHTRDLGYIDEAGLLHVKGRRDNMFISGGENIHPEEIEQALERHPVIDRAVVVPVPNREFGFRPVAFIQCGKAQASSEEITTFLSTKLPRYMLPIAYYELKDEVGMKFSRKELAKSAASFSEET